MCNTAVYTLMLKSACFKCWLKMNTWYWMDFEEEFVHVKSLKFYLYPYIHGELYNM